MGGAHTPQARRVGRSARRNGPSRERCSHHGGEIPGGSADRFSVAGAASPEATARGTTQSVDTITGQRTSRWPALVEADPQRAARRGNTDVPPALVAETGEDGTRTTRTPLFALLLDRDAPGPGVAGPSAVCHTTVELVTRPGDNGRAVDRRTRRSG